MTPAKLNVLFAFFPYGGNGGVSSEHPSIRDWWGKLTPKLLVDPRVGKFWNLDYCDTPVTMTRNAAAEDARKLGADLLFMIDSDQHPDLYLGADPLAKPFWDTSFDFLYERRLRGLKTVVGAPYCGPPPHECVYVFRWVTHESDKPDTDVRLEMWSREDAAFRAGIGPAAALPTGMILFDTAVFDVIKPPYFYYEYEGDGPQCPHCGCGRPGPQSRKASTEDVTATRDILLFGREELGDDVLFCNWDAWAGHYKPKCVGKPRPITTDQVGQKYRDAVLRNRRSDERLVNVRPQGGVESLLSRMIPNGEKEKAGRAREGEGGRPG